jgi:hypothetical protein
LFREQIARNETAITRVDRYGVDRVKRDAEGVQERSRKRAHSLPPGILSNCPFSSAKWKPTAAPCPAAASARVEPASLPSSSTVPSVQGDAPGKAGHRHPAREDIVRQLACCCDSLGTCCCNDERHLDRPRRAVSSRMQHLHLVARRSSSPLLHSRKNHLRVVA